MNVNCKYCYNPFGTLKGKTLEIDYKRISGIKTDFEKNEVTLKCRRCSTISVIGYKDELKNEINQQLSSRELL